MDVARVAQALQLLREQGLEVRLEPGFVAIRVGRLEVVCPGHPNKTNVLVDGQELRHLLVAVDVRVALHEVPRATLTLDMLLP